MKSNSKAKWNQTQRRFSIIEGTCPGSPPPCNLRLWYRRSEPLMEHMHSICHLVSANHNSLCSFIQYRPALEEQRPCWSRHRPYNYKRQALHGHGHACVKYQHMATFPTALLSPPSTAQRLHPSLSVCSSSSAHSRNSISLIDLPQSRQSAFTRSACPQVLPDFKKQLATVRRLPR